VSRGMLKIEETKVGNGSIFQQIAHGGITNQQIQTQIKRWIDHPEDYEWEKYNH